jgi:hypothetical protein
LAWSTENEILGLFSTSNAFHRQERIGILPKLQQLKKNNDKLRIRIPTPFDDHIDSVSSIRSTVISYVTIFEIIWRQQELYQQLSKFRQRIETYELVNKQLNDTIVDLKHQLNF